MDTGRRAAEPGAPGVRRALGFLPPGAPCSARPTGWLQEGEGCTGLDPTRSGESQASLECSPNQLRGEKGGKGGVKVGGGALVGPQERGGVRTKSQGLST